MEAQMALFEKSSPGLIVETVEGTSFTVSSDLKTCSCGNGSCAHVNFVQRLVPDSALKWVLVSAMHKELRRGDVRKALSWGYWLSIARSPAKVRSYLRAIVFEETRSLSLYLASRREKRWEAIIPMFAATRKKWEVSSRAGLDVRLLRQWGLPPLEEAQLFEWAQNSTDVDQLYKVVCDAWKKSPMVKYQLAKILGERGGVEAISEENFNGLCFLAEKVAGVLGEDADFRLPYEEANLEGASQYVPPVMDYVYDPHTMEGRKRIKAAFSDIRPGVPLPLGIDLRWSGASVGFAWRSLAVAQLGVDRYKDARWEEVQFPEQVWNDAVKADTDWGLIV